MLRFLKSLFIKPLEVGRPVLLKEGDTTRRAKIWEYLEPLDQYTIVMLDNKTFKIVPKKDLIY